MDARTAAVITVLTLCVCHLRIRRNPGRQADASARFYLFAGYPAVVISVFWLTQAQSALSWEWVFGNVWALVATVLLVRGLDSLDRTATDRSPPHAPTHAFPRPAQAGQH
jgi:hypothetical protein